VALTDQEMVVRRSDIDSAVPDGLSVVRVGCYERARAGDDGRQDPIAFLGHMDGDKDGGGKVGGESGNELAYSIDAAGRGTDDDDVAGRHADLDAECEAVTAREAIKCRRKRPLSPAESSGS